jgi:hypothetical protein
MRNLRVKPNEKNINQKLSREAIYFFIAFTADEGNSLKGQQRQSHPFNDGFIHLNFNLPFHQKVDPRADSENNLGISLLQFQQPLKLSFQAY